MIPGTLRELFTHNDWAHKRLLASASERNDAELDQPFEMGEGSLRKTIVHLWEAEECWLSRWMGTPFEDVDPSLSIEELGKRLHATATRREAWLEGHDTASLAGTFRYRRPSWMESGPDLEQPFDLSLLHVLNHGTHHRAQAINMIKRLGASPPTLDYLTMRLTEPPGPFDLSTLRRYLAYDEWAYHQVYEAAATLSLEAQNREFPIGPGTLQRILRHLAVAPAWWMDNLEGVQKHFPAIDATDEENVRTSYSRAVRRRDDYLSNLQDSDLQRMVSATPRPGVERNFPHGVAMLQLCLHATHHRAQALNMLRHSGAKVPALDVAVWHRTISK